MKIEHIAAIGMAISWWMVFGVIIFAMLGIVDRESKNIPRFILYCIVWPFVAIYELLKKER